MRVLNLVTDTDRRGAQIFGFELGARLRELGHQVETVALAPGSAGGLDLPTLGKHRVGLSTMRALRSAMAEVDVVAAHGSATLLACAAAGFRVGRPVVYRQISDPVFWTPTRSRRARVRLYYKRVTRVIALSPTTRTALHERFGVPLKVITVVPNGVEDRRCPPASDGDRLRARTRFGVDGAVLAYVGALVEEKGVADLLAAAPEGSTVVVAGEGPCRTALERQAASLPVTVHFLGPVSDPWSVYAAADVVVLPSRGGDTQPAVLIEAALVGTPCVSTPVGAIPDIIQHERNGILVQPADVAGLRTALVGLLADPTGRRAYAKQAQADARARFSLDVVARQWELVLAGVIDGG